MVPFCFCVVLWLCFRFSFWLVVFSPSLFIVLSMLIVGVWSAVFECLVGCRFFKVARLIFLVVELLGNRCCVFRCWAWVFVCLFVFSVVLFVCSTDVFVVLCFVFDTLTKVPVLLGLVLAAGLAPLAFPGNRFLHIPPTSPLRTSLTAPLWFQV